MLTQPPDIWYEVVRLQHRARQREAAEAHLAARGRGRPGRVRYGLRATSALLLVLGAALAAGAALAGSAAADLGNEAAATRVVGPPGGGR
jgi:hypothetical protein